MLNENIINLDPSDHRDCYWDVVNDTIASAAWTSTLISPAGSPALTIGAPTNTANRTTARVSGIAAGAKHLLKCVVTLTSGQLISRSRIVYGATQ